jgi:hypothetical protein
MSIRTLTALAFSFLTIALAPAVRADGAIICTGDSTGACAKRPYCCYTGSESDGDKYCQQLGCRRGGTSGSCPTAANVPSCGTRNVAVNQSKVQARDTEIAWCIAPARKDARAL